MEEGRKQEGRSEEPDTSDSERFAAGDSLDGGPSADVSECQSRLQT